jgi:hypothetical protein
MIVRNRSFPYPVLAPFRDDVSPNAFSISVTIDADADWFYLSTKFAYENASLEAMTGRNEAFHVLHVECKRNYYRRLFPLAGRSGGIAISTSDLVGRVEVSGYIIASQPVEGYCITGSHPDYGGSTFQVQQGDVLAVAQTVLFDAYADYDPLSQISSILSVKESEAEETGPIQLDTTGDRLVVTLAKQDYGRYVELKGDPMLGPLLANQIVVPALLDAVHEMQSLGEDDFETEMEKRWFRSVARKLEELGVDIGKPETSALDAVQALLSLPLRRSLEGLIRITAEDGEE